MERESGGESELESVKVQLELLQIELCDVVLSRDKALNECGKLRSKSDGQRSTIDTLNNLLKK